MMVLAAVATTLRRRLHCATMVLLVLATVRILAGASLELARQVFLVQVLVSMLG
jgi:hypothetical protein